MNGRMKSIAPMLVLAVSLWPLPAQALDHVAFKRDGKEHRIAGQLLMEAADGSLMIESDDGAISVVTAEELQEHTADEVAFVPLGPEELSQRLLAELPEGFEVHATSRYLICYNTSGAYAQWCGALFERLYKAFTNFWSRRGFDLHKPEFPLVAMVFADRESYRAYARAELGDAVNDIIGYYNPRSNRMTMYDLTGNEALRQPGDRRGSASQINQMLARPEAERSVATVVHEATHQIAYNVGLNVRHVDTPLWVSEGIAVYFETPDLRSAKGWSTIGGVNEVRLAAFRQYLSRRPADSLISLISDNARLRDPRQAGDAYAESWALTYFLLNQRGEQYFAYLKRFTQPRSDDAQTRLEEFRQAFGDDLERLDADFVRRIGKLR